MCLSCSFVHHCEASFVKELNCWLITTKLRVQNILIPANTTGEIPVSSNSTRSKLHLHYFVTCKHILWEKKEGEQSRRGFREHALFSILLSPPSPTSREVLPTMRLQPTLKSSGEILLGFLMKAGQLIKILKLFIYRI